jgi:hypothetical protein
MRKLMQTDSGRSSRKVLVCLFFSILEINFCRINISQILRDCIVCDAVCDVKNSNIFVITTQITKIRACD